MAEANVNYQDSPAGKKRKCDDLELHEEDEIENQAVKIQRLAKVSDLSSHNDITEDKENDEHNENKDVENDVDENQENKENQNNTHPNQNDNIEIDGNESDKEEDFPVLENDTHKIQQHWKDLIQSGEEDNDNEAINRRYTKLSKSRGNRPQKPPKTIPLPEPEAYLYPVVLEDLKTGSAHFEAFCPYTQTVFDTIGLKPIRRQKRLLSGRWLIDTRDDKDQQKLAQSTTLGQVNVRCYIPRALTHGVIRPFPVGQDANKIKASHPAITKIQRLSYRDRRERDPEKSYKDSKAVKVTFQLADLPKTLIVGSEIFVVVPYVESVRRCANCQKLDHPTDHCRTRIKVCPRCGKEAHGTEPCSAPLRCVNCHGDHSAAWHQCPIFQLRRRANEIKATTAVPFGLALRKAREESGDVSPRAPVYKHQHFYRPIQDDSPSDTSSSLPAAPAQLAVPRSERSQPLTLQPPPSQVGTRHAQLTVLGKPAAARRQVPSSSAASQVPGDDVDPSHSRTDNVRPNTQKSKHNTVSQDDFMVTFEKRMTDMMNTLSNKLDSRLQALESKPAAPTADCLIQSVMDKLQRQRKQQALQLSQKIRDLEQQKDTDPVTVLIGQLMEGLVEATIDNKPSKWLTLTTNLYNKSKGKGHKTPVPTWDARLRSLGSLTLGLADSDEQEQFRLVN